VENEVRSAVALDFASLFRASVAATSLVIDGGTVSGKSTLAERLCVAHAVSRPVVTISYDAFLRARSERQGLYDALMQGDISPRDYHEGTWDFARLDEVLRRTIDAAEGSMPATVLVPITVEREASGAEHPVTIEPGTFVIIEGTGALFPVRPQSDGLRIWCCGPSPEVAIKRKLRRFSERHIVASEEAVTARYFGAELVHDRWVESVSRPRAHITYVPEPLEAGK
jgi:uridine kinase